jgi:hypothetical protein
MTALAWQANFSADCPTVNGSGMQCMICTALATGHLTAGGGPHDGRCLAVTCTRHSSEEGWPEVHDALVAWAAAGLLALNGGPGPAGAPEVWHGDHWDPMPTREHDRHAAQRDAP